MGAVDVEQGVSVAIGALGGGGAESGREIDEGDAGELRDGFFQH
jgi:hypothetical protein